MDSGSCPDYESNFTLGFLPTNATLNTDCSSQWTGDACINSLDLSFSPGNCSLTVTMELAQDQIFEAREQLLMFIANCSNCVSNVTSVQPVEIIIDDSSDCKHVHVLATYFWCTYVLWNHTNLYTLGLKIELIIIDLPF